MTHCVYPRKSREPVACFAREPDARAYLLLDRRRGLEVHSAKSAKKSRRKAKKARR